MYYVLINSMNKTSTPSIVTGGLVLNLDAGNPLSYSGSGTAWNDLSGNANNATLVNGVTYSSSNGGILNFDGTNDKVIFSFGDIMDIIPTRPASVSMWCRFNNTNSRQVLFADWNSGGGSETSVLQIAGSSSTTMKLQGWLQTGTYPGLPILNSTNFVAPNTWYYVTIQNTNSTNSELYINGVLNATASTVFISYTPNGALSLGSGGQYNALFLNGSISSFQVYNTSLTQTQITNNFNAYKTRYGY